MKNKLPNNRTIDFLIIGAMKSGTTAVAENMNSHPEIFIPESKEPSYFINWEKNLPKRKRRNNQLEKQ